MWDQQGNGPEVLPEVNDTSLPPQHATVEVARLGRNSFAYIHRQILTRNIHIHIQVGNFELYKADFN